MSTIIHINGDGTGTVVSKKIALFEYTPKETGNRLRRQDAIKRKNSDYSSSASSVSGSTVSSSSDLEIQLEEDYAATASSSNYSSSEVFEDTYDSGGSTNGVTMSSSSSPAEIPISDSGSSSSGIYPGFSGSGSSDDYEFVSRKIGKAAESETLNQNSFSSTTKRKSLKKDCQRSLRHPFIPGHLQLVEFSEIQLDTEEDHALASRVCTRNDHKKNAEVEEAEPFYEELDNYGHKSQKAFATCTENEVESEKSTDSLHNSDKEGENENENELRALTEVSVDSTKDEETIEYLTSPIEIQDESPYSEPMYQGNVQGGSASGSRSTSSGPSLYNRSTNSDKNPYSPLRPQSSSQDTNNRIGIYDLNNTPSSWYDLSIPSASLPPVPATITTANKFSSIAKSAGKKLSKKLNYLRRLSRTSFDGSGDIGGSSSSEFYSTLSLNQNSSQSSSQGLVNPTTNTQLSSTTSSSSSRNPNYSTVNGKRNSAILRPSIPPPEPPRNPPVNSETINGSSSNSITNTQHTDKIVPHLAAETSGNGQNFEDDMDDDDSDFYDSDSELIRNFVAAVQPIYSMEEEPLYQYYTYGISLQPENTNYQPVIPKNLGLTLDMLVPRTGQRTLWCELPEVISSGILSILSEQQKKLQEAIFEILTSEVSYLKSLDVLVMLFFENDSLIQLLTPEERSTLFGNITYVKDCAQSFLSELLSKWEESWYIQDVGQVINDNANNKFHVYKEYCRNKPYQDKMLKKLRNTNDEFVNIIKTIEEDSKCQLLGMDSFLMLPMQRITRLPLLVNAIIQRTQSPKEKTHCEDALKSLTNLVLECNEAAKESQDAEETAAIFEKLEFPKTNKTVPTHGQFVLKGDFMKNPFDSGRGQKINWTFQKNKKTFYWLILFTNQLFITKKKSSGKFEVLDMMSPLDANIKPLPNLEGISKDFQHFFMLHFDRNETVYFLAARTQSEIERWKQNLEQLKSKKDLKVKAIYPYDAKLKDEMSFAVGDVILLTQTQPDGWHYGRKINTEEAGWFPGNYCIEC